MPEMKKILGERGTGKTTELLKYAAEHKLVVIEPTYRMAFYASHMAAEKGIKATVVSIDTFLRMMFLYEQDFKSLCDCKGYVFDELDACLQQMGVFGYSNTIVLKLDADANWTEGMKKKYKTAECWATASDLEKNAEMKGTDIYQKSIEDAKTLDGMKSRAVNPWAVEKDGIEYGRDRCECCGMKLLHRYSSTVRIWEEENETDFILCDRCIQDLKAFIMSKKLVHLGIREEKE
jgi:hypothetical protein